MHNHAQSRDYITSIHGATITYDAIGNPLSYYNGSSYTFTWEGRRLVGAVSGGKTYSFTYNDEGIRTSKTVNGVEHKYYLSGSRIMAEEWEENLLVFVYDSTGSPIGMMYRMDGFSEGLWEKYWFEKNMWGDITAIYDDAGNLIIEYKYDPWGNCTEEQLMNSYGAQYNPFRYRGYYYDADLGLYYLNARYYDSNTCRFISPDKYIPTGQGLIGYNMYAYCNNNPIMGYDPTGEWTFSLNLNVFIGAGEGYAFSLGLSFDSEEMIAFQWTYSIPDDYSENTEGIVYGASASIGAAVQITGLDSVSDLQGTFTNYGINTPEASADALTDSLGKFVGVSIGLGASVGGDVHIIKTQTSTIGSEFKSFIKWLKDKLFK